MNTLYTKRGEELKSRPEEIPWRVHPRPLLKRSSFEVLNGWWTFSVTEGGPGPVYEGRIRVPFPPESALSGVARHFAEGAALIYEKRVELSDGFFPSYTYRVLLHIDGADQHCRVFVNGSEKGFHSGGYQHYTLDITDALGASPQAFDLRIEVTDDLHDRTEPYGKQRLRPRGMWYTPFSGLWQSVWLEAVPQRYIKHIDITTDMNRAIIDTGDPSLSGDVTVNAPDGELKARLENGMVEIAPEVPRLWSPEDPYLYTFEIKLDDGDEISSYFALREIARGEYGGRMRILFNGKPVFLHALLDQGYWSDGLCTPADPLSYEDDIQLAKDMGFNTLRKHIRVEPDLFYEACDRLGVIVMQDMVNNGRYSFLWDTALPNVGISKRSSVLLHTDKVTGGRFIERMKQTVTQLSSFPSILYWTIFNEGWGQFDAPRVYGILKKLDDTRLIDSASGWFDQGVSDVDSVHIYGHRYRFEESDRPVVLSECGGYSCKIEGSVSDPSKVYGYGAEKSTDELIAAIEELFDLDVIPFISRGLCGSVYTQLSDVENELNGIITYDRQVVKLPADRMLELAEKLKDEISEITC